MPSTPTAYWMPNDGIQSTRSTNWKSARVGSKRLQSSSVAANTSERHAEGGPADDRVALVRRGSRTSSSSSAPASGSDDEQR